MGSAFFFAASALRVRWWSSRYNGNADTHFSTRQQRRRRQRRSVGLRDRVNDGFYMYIAHAALRRVYAVFICIICTRQAAERQCLFEQLFVCRRTTVGSGDRLRAPPLPLAVRRICLTYKFARTTIFVLMVVVLGAVVGIFFVFVVCVVVRGLIVAGGCLRAFVGFDGWPTGHGHMHDIVYGRRAERVADR